MMIYAQFQDLHAERRRTDRRVLALQTEAVHVGRDARTDVEVRDLSATGFLMRANVDFAPHEKLAVQIDGNSVQAKVVWRSGSLFGCEFDRPLSKALVGAALLKSAPTNRSEGDYNSAAAALRHLESRLQDLSQDLDDFERTLLIAQERARAERTNNEPATASSAIEDDSVDDRYPLAVRGWTILLASLGFWAVILWFAFG